MAGLGTLITLIIILIVVALGYFLYQWYESLADTSGGYCQSCSATGEDGGPMCPAGYVYYGGLCYIDRWTKFGGTKTASCSISYSGECNGAGYGCYVDITQQLAPGTLCDDGNVPGWNPANVGYFVVNGYNTNYCAKGGTHDIWCDEGDAGGQPTICPDDADYFESECCKAKCPSDKVRTELCTCGTL